MNLFSVFLPSIYRIVLSMHCLNTIFVCPAYKLNMTEPTCVSICHNSYGCGSILVFYILDHAHRLAVVTFRGQLRIASFQNR